MPSKPRTPGPSDLPGPKDPPGRKPPKIAPPKLDRNVNDTGDVLRLNENLSVTLTDSETLIIVANGRQAVLDWQQNSPATETVPASAVVRIRLVPAPYVAPSGEPPIPADPYAGRPDPGEVAPDA